MGILRRAKRNMFVDHRQVKRRRIKIVSAITVTIAVAVVFLTLSGIENPVALKSSPDNVSKAEASTGESDSWKAVAAIDPGTGCGGAPAAAPAPAPKRPAPKPKIDVVHGKVKKGQTAAAMLDDLLSAAEIHEIEIKCKGVYSLSRLQAGRPYRLETEAGDFKRLVYEIDNESMLVVGRSGDGFAAARKAIHYDVEMVIVHGDIESSLFEAVDMIGESPSLAVRLAEIFAWDIDFVHDIRRGDSFRVVVEKRYRDGKFAGYGEIPAAMFVNQGRESSGYLFADKDGRQAYYDEQGRSLRKAFLKAPLSYTRVSSGYSMSRLHPILKIRRPHPGIDYAAPRGTPVKSVGDGVVVKAAWDSGGGRYVKIRHNSVYETSYMHLSGYAKGIRKGARVRQGQVIGYVGSTGLATGPHLDFRMTRNGGFVNPGKIVSPPCDPVSSERMAEFAAFIAENKARLETGGLLQASAGHELDTLQ